MHDQLVVADGRVHVGELADGVDDGPGDEGQETQLGLTAHAVDGGVVDLGDHQRVGADGERPQHVGGGIAAGPRELDDVVVVTRHDAGRHDPAQFHRCDGRRRRRADRGCPPLLGGGGQDVGAR